MKETYYIFKEEDLKLVSGPVQNEWDRTAIFKQDLLDICKKVIVDKEKIINIIWHSGVVVIAIGLLTLIGVHAYKHRVVESKAYDVVATIDDKEHIPEYVTKTVYKDSDGRRRTRRHKHPARYIITYTVTFEGGIYGGNKQDVSKDLYESKKVGDEIPATFVKEWHADGEETYTIKLK